MRKRANAEVRQTVKTSVPLDIQTHSRLCAWAAMLQQDRGTLAAEILRRGLRHVAIRVGDVQEPDPDGSSGAEQGGSVK